MTWLEVKEVAPNDLLEPDALQPTVVEKGLGKCEKCWSYYFKSVADKKKHMSMIHRPFHRREVTNRGTGTTNVAVAYSAEPLPEVTHTGRPMLDPAQATRKHKCRVCKTMFGSNAKLRKHMKTEEHNPAGVAKRARALAAAAAVRMQQLLPQPVPVQPVLDTNTTIAAPPPVVAIIAPTPDAVIIVPPPASTAVIAAPPPIVESDGDDNEECEVVGVRRTGSGGYEPFMYWTDYGKDDCTYEETGKVKEDYIIGENIVVHQADGKSFEAHVASLGTDRFLLERYGATARSLPRSPATARQVRLQLAGWDSQSIVGWNVIGFTEHDAFN